MIRDEACHHKRNPNHSRPVGKNSLTRIIRAQRVYINDSLRRPRCLRAYLKL